MKPADLLPDDALFARLEHYGHCDVLIDRMVGWPLLDQLSGNAAVVVTAEPLADRLFEGIPDESPILVRLSGEGTALISSYLSEAIREAKDMSCQTRAVCGFLFSEAPLGKLAKRLTHQLEMRVTGGKSIFFRYFDPRVMHHLPSIFRPEQMGQLLSDIDYWMYIDWGGNAVTLNNADYPAVAPQDTRRLVAHSQQWLALQDSRPYLQHVAKGYAAHSLRYRVLIGLGHMAGKIVARVRLLVWIARFNLAGLALTAAEIGYLALKDDALQDWAEKCVFRKYKERKGLFASHAKPSEHFLDPMQELAALESAAQEAGIR